MSDFVYHHEPTWRLGDFWKPPRDVEDAIMRGEQRDPKFYAESLRYRQGLWPQDRPRSFYRRGAAHG